MTDTEGLVSHSHELRSRGLRSVGNTSSGRLRNDRHVDGRFTLWTGLLCAGWGRVQCSSAGGIHACSGLGLQEAAADLGGHVADAARRVLRGQQ